VHPDVSFRVPLRLLRAADERLNLREQPFDDAEIQRDLPSPRRARCPQQQLLDFSPDAFRRKVVEGKAAAELARVRVEGELEPCRELHRAQDAETVVAEGT
jgi:hypothetical protein